MIVLKKGEFFGSVVNIRHQEGVTVSVTDYREDDKEASCNHYHEHPNITFILRGGSIEKKKSVETEKFPGNLMHYYAGQVHQNIRKGFPGKSMNLEVEFSFLDRFQIQPESLETAIRNNPDAKFLLLEIYKELLINDNSAPVCFNLLLLNLISKSKELKNINNWPGWAKIVFEIINDRWNEQITLTELSLYANVNPITISKHFPKYIGCTLGEYLRKKKTEKALDMIRGTELPLTEIAHHCGFADQSHFIRTFKYLTKFAPLQYKKI